MHWYVLTALCLLPAIVRAQAAAPSRWRVAERPTLSLGSRETDGPTLFGNIAGAVRLSTGTVVVADRASLELRYFSPTGQYLTTTGRKGGGPGEFETQSFVLRCAGDSVFVYDVALFRMSIFGPDGRYVRAANLRKWLANGMTPYDAWCNPAGVLAFVNRTPEAFNLPPREGPLRPQVEILLVTSNDSVRSLGRFPASEMYFKAPQAGPRPLGRRTTIGVGSRVVYVGTGDTYEVSQFSVAGDRLPALRAEWKPIAVKPAQVTEYITDYIADHRGRGNTAGFEAYFRSLDWPSTYPAYARLLVDLADNLWIQDYPVPGDDIRTWSVYAPSGSKLALIQLPKDFQLLEAGKDYVFGLWQDADGVQYVRQYAIAH